MAVFNNVTLLGRLTRDPEIRYSSGEKSTAFCRVSVAVNRDYKNADGNYDADFITISAIGKTAELIEKYFHRGELIAVNGNIQTGSYTNKDGNTVYTTEVHVEKVGFVPGSKGSSGNKEATRDDSFVNVPDGIEEELPFN